MEIPGCGLSSSGTSAAAETSNCMPDQSSSDAVWKGSGSRLGGTRNTRRDESDMRDGTLPGASTGSSAEGRGVGLGPLEFGGNGFCLIFFETSKYAFSAMLCG